MNLLLLFSAMLSALTGAVTGTRAETPRQMAAVSVAVAAEIVAAPRVEAGERPTATLPTLAAVAALPSLRSGFTIQVQPLYASRRRE